MFQIVKYLILCIVLHGTTVFLQDTTLPPIPESFDAREEWPKCAGLIGFVHTKGQGFCTSSWALATASAISDRICISSKGNNIKHLSGQEFLECCPTCGTCLGGQPFESWKYWVEEGIPTGGEFESQEGCKPYSIAPELSPTTDFECNARCRSQHQGVYREEKLDSRGMKYYSFEQNEIESIQRDIMEFGPVVAVLRVYLDFLALGEHTVYINSDVVSFGQQSVKIIGWGTSEEGVDYWLATNTLGIDWGNAGFFRIRRGTDEVGIESTSVSAGLPSIVRNSDFNICQPTDLVFVVDGPSAGVRTERTLMNVVGYMDLIEQYRVGIVLVSDTIAVTTLALGEETDKVELLDDMDDYVYQTGNSPLGLAEGITRATNELNTNGRAETLRMMVIVLKETNVTEDGVRDAARMAKQYGIWVLLAATDTQQRAFLSRIPNMGQYRFVNSGYLGKDIPEEDMYYLLPLLIEENCLSNQICYDCLFNNGVYMQGISGKCDMYYHCRKPLDTNPYRRTCPLGKFWDRDTLTCVWPLDTICWADPCVGGATNFWPNEHHCGAYWKCNNSQTSELLCCPRGQKWNQVTEVCEEDAACSESQYCFNKFVCNMDLFLTFRKTRGLGDLIGYAWIQNTRVAERSDARALDGFAGYFNGGAFLDIPYYSNHDLGEQFQIYVRFMHDGDDDGLIEMLVTDGGCVPLEPAVFLGYEPGEHVAYAYIRTSHTEKEISLQLLDFDPESFVNLWFIYNGVSLTLQSDRADGTLYSTSEPVIGNIIRTRNSMKIGSSNYPYFGHTFFHGYIDEVAISQCEDYIQPVS